MTDQGVPESWHIPRALSSEALRLLSSLPMDEIERRLRMEPTAVEGQPSDEEVGELTDDALYLIRELRDQADDLSPSLELFGLLHNAADLLEQLSAFQPLRSIPASERLPGPEDCQPWPGEPDETHWCWVFVKGPLGVDSWQRLPVTCLTGYRSMHTHWLPANALPLPEAKP